jgi:DNA invertase Pin-like site-specific DNA recombinase
MTSSTQDPALSYTRYSDGKQHGNDSQGRQDEDFASFCQRWNLKPGSVVYADRARSGYHGEHVKKGKLGQLIDLAEAGGLAPRTVVVVEAWDRLGRLRPDKQVNLIQQLLQTGARIGICKLNDIFSEEDFGTHKWTTLAVFIQLAYQESKQKGERVASKWKKKRDAVRTKQPGALFEQATPAWCKIANGRVVEDKAKADAVRLIFKLAGSGFGNFRIAKRLNADRVAPIGKNAVWEKGYITSLLNDRRVLGEWQPMVGGKPDGDVVRGYFPQVVGEEAFNLAREGAEERKRSPREAGRVARDGAVNVFRGLFKDARDGGNIVLLPRANRDGRRYHTLVSATAKKGQGEKHVSFPYDIFERQVLKRLREVKPDEVTGKGSAAQELARALEAEWKGVRQRIKVLAEIQDETPSKTTGRQLSELEGREEALKERVTKARRDARPLAQMWDECHTLMDALDAATDKEEARLRLKAALGRVVKQAWLLVVPRKLVRLAVVQFDFTDGGRRHYLLFHRPPHQFGKKRTEAYADSATYCWDKGDVPLDLRNPDHVAELAQDLTAVDLSGLAG